MWRWLFLVRKVNTVKVKHCACGAALSLRNKAGKCRDCYFKERYYGDAQTALTESRRTVAYVRRMLMHLRVHIDGILAELPEDGEGGTPQGAVDDK